MKKQMQDAAAAMGLTLTDRQAEQFVRYYELLVEWNEKMNLTAITEWNEVLAKHFLDSLTAAARLREQFGETFSLVDVGTGAGFPGIPLKIFFPEMKLLLLDSLQKRVGFLQTVCDELGFTSTECLHGRAEEVAQRAEYREQYDVAVARAVSALPALAEYCTGYVKPGGRFVAYKGPGWQEEYEGCEELFSRLCLRKEEAVEAEIPGADLRHVLVFFKKQPNLSLKYPRSQSKIKAK